jgi:hypothetical protein
MMIKYALSAALATALVSATAVLAQSSGSSAAPQIPPAAKAADKPAIPLRVQVTLSRFTGETKTSSLPFTLWVNANDQQKTTLNVGMQVPVGTGYRGIGTNLQCGATGMDDGRFRVELSIEDSSVAPSKESGGSASFQSLTTHNFLLLRDGQNAQFVAATDKVTGEVTKVDVTVTVLK